MKNTFLVAFHLRIDFFFYTWSQIVDFVFQFSAKNSFLEGKWL